MGHNGGYPHFMLKEIYEQPEALRNTITPRIVNELPDFTEDGIDDEVFKNLENITVVACGTAMHAGIVGKAMIEKELKIPVNVEIASEFRYKEPLINEKTLVIVTSQSGETIDTLEALRLAKRCGSKVLSIVNVKGSITSFIHMPVLRSQLQVPRHIRYRWLQCISLDADLAMSRVYTLRTGQRHSSDSFRALSR